MRVLSVHYRVLDPTIYRFPTFFTKSKEGVRPLTQVDTSDQLKVSIGGSANSVETIHHMHVDKFQSLIQQLESLNWTDFWKHYYSSKSLQMNTLKKIKSHTSLSMKKNLLAPQDGPWFKALFCSDIVLKDAHHQLLQALPSPAIAMVGDCLKFSCEYQGTKFTLVYRCSYD